MINVRQEARGELWSKAHISFLSGRSLKIVERWVSEGLPALEAPKAKGGEFKFASAQVFDWFEAGRYGLVEKLDLTSERARLAKVQADSQTLKNQVACGELLPAADVEARWEAAVSRTRQLLLGIPMQAATIVMLAQDKDNAEQAVRGLLLKLIDGALGELTRLPVDEDGDGPDQQIAA